ncbi:MAG: hypothetical protein WBA74_00590, partial [Cyclobacteriaceae bacterium]
MKRLLITSILLLFSIFYHSCNTGGLDDLDKGQYNLHAERYRHSNPDSTIYYALLSLDNSYQAEHEFYSHYLIAYAHEKKTEFKEAAISYESAINSIPIGKEYDLYRFKILFNLGRIMYFYGNHDLAVAYFQKAKAYTPENKEKTLNYILGIALIRNNDAKEATEAYLVSLGIAQREDNILKESEIQHQRGLLYGS